MFNVISTAKSGMNSYQEKIDYISNDLANVGTTGYKSTDIGFKDLLTESLNKKGTPLNDKTATTGTGVKLGVNYIDSSQGNLVNTGGQTDLALDGKGYFGLYQSDGSVAYTRDGNFKIDSDGVLVNTSGDKVYIEYSENAGEAEPALIASDLSINSKGKISMKKDEKIINIGTIPVFNAIGDKGFVQVGNNCYKPAEGANVTLSDDYDVLQGFLEGSNVDASESFTDMILTQRAFQLNSKALTVADDLWGMVNNMR